MGNSNCCVVGNTKSKLPFTGDTEPNDDFHAHPRANNILLFQIKISNIKLKFIPQSQAFLHVDLADATTFNTQKKKRGNDNCIKWDIQKKIQIKVTELQLRKKFIEITVYNQEEIDVAQVRINLYKISTGPYHHDFSLIYPHNVIGRICVDIRVTQIVEILIKSQQTSAILFKEKPQQLFNYSIKTITLTNTHNKESETSYNAEITSMKKSQKKLPQLDNNNSQKKLVKNNSINDHELTTHKINWTVNQANVRGLSLPHIKSSILISDFSTASFQFLLWQVSKNKNLLKSDSLKKSKYQSQQQTNMLCGQCYVPFNKIVEKDFQIMEKGNMVFECRKLQLAQKIWIHGKLIGEMKMKFTVVIPEYYKQMIVFVRTQEGIQKTSPIFNTAENLKIQCVQLRELNKLKVQLEQLNTKIGCAVQHNKKELEIKRLKQDIKFTLYKIQPLLSFTIRQSTFLYSYKIQAYLFRGQNTLLELGFKLLDYLQEQETSVHNICWKCLTLLLRRGEFTLLSIGFQQSNKEIKEKIDIAIKYQSFLYRSLKVVLMSLNKKALQENERVFVQLFCAYSFFRIPEFRKVFLNAITKTQDQDVDEFEINSFILKKPNKQNQNTFNLLFDWQSHFYRYLPPQDQRVKQNYIQLNEILNMTEWKHRMQKRGIAFFFFISFWTQYVKEIAINSQNIKWKYLPGYVQLLSAFILEMKTRPIAMYPDGLKDASIKLLENQRLLNVFITILFQKTNIYDSISVMNTLEIVNQYFKDLHGRKKQLPTMFNYTFFLVGIRDMLTIDHSFIVSRCMLLLYNHYNMFNSDFKNDISLILLGKLFFKLFLHWSKNVRNMFYHLLIFRIRLQSSIMKKSEPELSAIRQQNINNQDIQRKLKNLREILQKTEKKKKSEQFENLNINHEKQLYRRMKKKRKSQFIKKERNKQPGRINLIRIKSNYEVVNKGTPLIYPTSSPFMKHTVSNTFELNSPTKIRKQITPLIQSNQSIQDQLEEKHLKKIPIKKMYVEEEDAAIQEILPEHFQYLEQGLKQFYAIQELYEQKFKNCTELDAVPIVEIKIPIDEGQSRPEIIDQW